MSKDPSNVLFEKFEKVVLDIVLKMKGPKSNQEIVSAVKDVWPENLQYFSVTPSRIAKILSRNGFERWAERTRRGWFL